MLFLLTRKKEKERKKKKGGGGGGGRWADPVYILKLTLSRFAKQLHVVYESQTFP